MATPDEVRTAVQHVQNCTGQEDAWQAGLTSTEVAIASVPSLAVVATPEQLDAILAKIHQQRPWLFEPSTGAPVTPPGPAPNPPAPTGSAPSADERQRGAAAETMKDAEAALARLNSDVAEFDRHMLEAILQAHQTTEDGKKQLEQLENDIENAVKTRKLDTPLGAREFQRYLIGKLNDILAVVAAANDSAASKAALAAALAALYAAQGGDGKQGETGPSPPAAPDDPPVPDTAVDPDLDSLPPDEPVAVGQGLPAADTAAPPPAAPVPPQPLPGLAAPSGGALPAGLPVPGLLPGPAPERPPKDLGDDPLLPDDMSDDVVPEQDLDGPPDDEPAAPESAPVADPTTVTLPDGETVTAASPQLAAAIKAAADGTPIADAFRQQGITIPPPGTAVTDPIDPSQLAPGDIGMFTDRHALAVGHNNALLDGQIQRIANVNGPSFLGWQHPPAPETTVTPTAPGPTTSEPPIPTRPSRTVAT